MKGIPQTSILYASKPVDNDRTSRTRYVIMKDGKGGVRGGKERGK